MDELKAQHRRRRAAAGPGPGTGTGRRESGGAEARPDRTDPALQGMLALRSINRASGLSLGRLGVIEVIEGARAVGGSIQLFAARPITAEAVIEGFIGHFSGIGSRARPDPAGTSAILARWCAVAMADIIAVLEDAAIAAGAIVRMGAGVSGCAEDADGVTVDTAAGSVRAQWLVACDGGRKRAGKLAGTGFPGTDAERPAHWLAAFCGWRAAGRRLDRHAARGVAAFPCGPAAHCRGAAGRPSWDWQRAGHGGFPPARVAGTTPCG